MSDRVDAAVGQPLLRHGADTPHETNRQWVQELALVQWIDHDETVGLGNLRCDLGEVFGGSGAHRDGQADFVANSCPESLAISPGGPNRCTVPATSRNASSMEMRCT